MYIFFVYHPFEWIQNQKFNIVVKYHVYLWWNLIYEFVVFFSCLFLFIGGSIYCIHSDSIIWIWRGKQRWCVGYVLVICSLSLIFGRQRLRMIWSNLSRFSPVSSRFSKVVCEFSLSLIYCVCSSGFSIFGVSLAFFLTRSPVVNPDPITEMRRRREEIGDHNETQEKTKLK